MPKEFKTPAAAYNYARKLLAEAQERTVPLWQRGARSTAEYVMGYRIKDNPNQWVFRVLPNEPCHGSSLHTAPAEYAKDREKLERVFCLTNVFPMGGVGVKDKNDDRYKDAVMFLDYLLKRSPWAHMYATKNPEIALDKGVIMKCGDAPSSVGHLANSSLRFLWEYHHYTINFCEFVRAGIPERMAWVMCYTFGKNNTGGFTYGTNMGHRPMDYGLMDAAAITNYCRGDIQKRDRPGHIALYKDMSKITYAGVDDLWTSVTVDRRAAANSLIKFLFDKKVKVEEGGWGAVIVDFKFKLDQPTVERLQKVYAEMLGKQ